jgi:hypothetical protein
MTREDIRERIRVALNDDPDAPIFRDTATVNHTIDEALECLTEEAPLLKRTFTLPRRQGAMLYSLPGVGDHIMAVTRIWLPDLQRRLQVCELTDLDARHERWSTVSGDPWYWVPVDHRTFLVWPIPATGGGWLQVDALCWPEDFSDDGDEPRDLALSDHEALVVYGEMDGYLRQWDVARAAERWATFVRRWGSMRSSADLERMRARFQVRSGRSTQP